MKWMQSLAILLGMAVAVGPSGAAGAARGPVLVELFTSQGCSSCPVADAFVAELEQLGYGADRVVPLTFHVSYWDDLGWKDPFADELFNMRQITYSQVLAQKKGRGETTIHGPYTPQMVVDGRVHFSGALRETAKEQIDAALSRPTQISLEMKAVADQDGRTVRVAASAAAVSGAVFDTDRAKIGIFAALFRKSATTPVDRGENSGRTLDERFIVRALAGPRLFRGERPVNEATFELELEPGLRPEDCGVAVFVQALDSLAVLAARSRTIRETAR